MACAATASSAHIHTANQDDGSNGHGTNSQAHGTSIMLKDLQHGGAEHSLAMLNAAEYEAIELAAAGHKASQVVTHFKVPHIYNPSKDIDLHFDFGTRNGLINLSVDAENKTLEMAYLDFGTRNGLINLSVGDQGQGGDRAQGLHSLRQVAS